MSDEAVEAAARAIRAHVFTDVTTCMCGYRPSTILDWDLHRFRDGLAAAAPYIAAKALRDIAAEDGGSLLATAWVLRRADDIERAARAAGKDKTDGDH